MRTLFVSDCYFQLQDCTKNVLNIHELYHIYQNILFGHSINILKCQNVHIGYFILGPLGRLVVHIIVEPA